MMKEGTIGIPRKEGHYSAVHYWVKTCEKPSKAYGLNGGKIIKLSLKLDGRWICNYDSGWEIEPDCEEANLALCILLNNYN